MRFLPYKSPNLPNGMYNTAVTSKYNVGSQVRKTAVRLRSMAMVGKATLTDDLTKGVRKEARSPAMIIFFIIDCLSI